MNNLSTQNDKDAELDQSFSSFKPNSNPEREVVLPTSSSAKKPQKFVLLSRICWKTLKR